MDKSDIVLNLVLVACTAFVTDTLVRRQFRRQQKPDLTPTLWAQKWEVSPTIAYRAEWGGIPGMIGTEWDRIHLDTTLKVGSIWRCSGPNESRGVIVVTALYGPLIVLWDGHQLTHKGHYRLALLMNGDTTIFTNPIDPSWLVAILDPYTATYTSTFVDPGWEAIYESTETVAQLRASLDSLREKYNALADETGAVFKRNAVLEKTLHALLHEGIRETGINEYSIVTDPTFPRWGNDTPTIPDYEFNLFSAISVPEVIGDAEILTDNLEITDPELVAIVEEELETTETDKPSTTTNELLEAHRNATAATWDALLNTSK